MNKAIRYYTYAALSMLFWGLTFIWFKQANTIYNPITIIFLRLVISSVLLFGFGFLFKKIEKIKKKDYKWFLLLALTQPFFYFLGESFGLHLVSSTVASAIIATIPLFSPLAAIWFTREKVSVFIWLGIICSFSGILIMLVNPDLSLNAAPTGIALLFFAVFSAVAYSIIIKKLSGNYSALTIITGQNMIGALYFLPLFGIFGFGELISVIPDNRTIVAMIQLSVFGSCLAYLFFIIAVANLGMVKANIFTNLIPVFTAVFAYLILREEFSVQKVTGIIMVVSGIVISQIKEIYTLFRRTVQS